MKPADHFPAGLRILAVDDDPISLAILRRMLQECSYHVTTCGRATEALELLREDKDKFDLVISDVYMPDMDGFKLLELVGLEMDLPVIMMSANGETSTVMKGITHGACYYLLKPVKIEELRNIWQHVVRTLRREPKEHSASFEEGKINQQGGTRYADNTSSATDMTDCMWRNKKKEAKEDEEDHEQDNTGDLSMLKPPVVWSVDLHQQFVSAVNQLGIDKAVPKTILELMNVHGLTHENVASHLQEYWLYLKRLSGVTMQPNNLRASSDGQDAGYGGLIGLNEMLDYKTAVTNGHLPVQGRAVLHHANMVGGVGGALSGMLGISSPPDPYLLVQIAALRSMPLSRPQMEGSSPGNQAALLQSLSAVDFNPLCQSHLLSGIGPLQQQDDWPSLKAIQWPLDMGSLEGSNRNFAGSTSEEPTIQVLQQRAQQQGEGSPVNLPQATRILKLLSSDVNLGQADLMPNVVGAIPSSAIGLSNMCHSDRELGSFSSFSNASGSLIRSSIADTRNMSFIGSSGSLGCSFMELMNHGINESQDYYLKATTQRQVEGMFYEPEDTSSGDQSESNTIFQLEGANDIFTFQATSLNSANTQVFKERTLTAICDLDDRTFGQNSRLQVNVLQCKYMVNTILARKCYLMEQTCTSSADPIYKELFRIVKKADLIVQECSDEPLKLKSLLAQMDNVHAFVDVTVDWNWCTRLFGNDVEDCTRASVHSTFEQLKQQDLMQNKKLWDAHIAELPNQSMSTTGDPRTGERSNLADYLQGRVQNVMNAYDSLQGLLPWFVGASDPEAKRGEFLGMGTFGSVSQYTWFGMECAEKSFNPFLCEKQEHDFENEVGVMVCLNHPHVVRLICCHQDSTKCSIVMELMPTKLEKYIAGRKYPFTPQAAVDVMSQIASGMEYLHEQGVVHRDLKPNNILVCPNPDPELSADGYMEVKLADFGLAKTKVYTSASILNSQICGAAPWRAPEAFGEHFSAKKADVYSFAIMCSQILSGNLHPFGYPPLRVLERISSPEHERPSLPSNNNYPAELLSLIRECWAPDSQKRPNFSSICERLQEIRLGLLVCNGM